MWGRPAFAGFLSLLVAGLGQFYSGRHRRAAILFLCDVFGGLVCLLLFLRLPIAHVNAVLAGGLYLAYRVWVIANAVRIAARTPHDYRPRWFHRWFVCLMLVWPVWYGANLQIALTARAFLTEAFRVVTWSMEPTILAGDRVLVDKLAYGIPDPSGRGELTSFEGPERGDVVVYWNTTQDGQERVWLKRVVGLPGDTIQGAEGTIFINGEVLDEPYLEPNGEPSPDFGPVRIPEMKSPSHWSTSYFVIGDRRYASVDSRSPDHGLVHRNMIIGRVMVVFASADRRTGEIRWNRIGTLVR